jgi:hypothetical protein
LTYAAQKTAAADVNLSDSIRRALLRQAAVRGAAVADGASSLDQRERTAAKQVIDADQVIQSYIDMVVIVLDLAGQLPSPTDAQIDAAITTANTGAWNYIVKTRG